MTLQKLARELDETARQTAVLVEAVAGALESLADRSVPVEQARARAAAVLVSALHDQGRIEQRCQNMALAVRQFALLPPDAPDAVYDEIWASLTLDELGVPELPGVASNVSTGVADLVHLDAKR